MPVAAPLIAGAAASWATTAFVAASSTFGGALLAGAASFAASSLVGALVNKAPSIDNAAGLTSPGAGRTTQVRQPIAPHQIHYGHVKTSGVILFIHSKEDDFGRTFGDLYLIHGISGTKVKAIRTVYFGDELASLPKFGPGGSEIRIGKHLGESDQVADADFVSEIGAPHWTSSHRLRGRAYLATRLTWDAENLPQLENISCIVDGVDTIYDPRTGLTGFTNNAALCIANWITSPWGEGRTWDKLNEASVIEAANICDERTLVIHDAIEFTMEPGSPASSSLLLAEGGRVLDWGDGVRVSSLGTLPAGLSAGTTYYVIPGADETLQLATSVANAFAGAAVSISDAGSGLHELIYWDEAQYKLNGTYTLDQDKGTTLDQMRVSMAGYAFPRGGQWYIHAGAAALPTRTLTADDLRGELQIDPKRSMRDRINEVRGVFVNPDKNWQPDDSPILKATAELLAEDGGELLVREVRYPFVTSQRQVQRLMKAERENNRRQGTVTMPCKLTAMDLAPWDGCYVTIDGYLDAAQYRVMGWALSEDGAPDLQLQKDDADIWSWSAEEEITSATGQPIVLPDPNAIAAPTHVTVLTPNDMAFTKIFFSWDEVLAINLGGYDVNFRSHGISTWTSYGRIGAVDERKAVVEKVVPTDFRVRAVTGGGVPGSWTTNLAPGAPTSVTAGIAGGSPSVGEITWVNDPDCVTIQLFKDGVLFNNAVPGPDESISGLNDGAYKLRSVNADGNVSALSAEVTVAGVGAGIGGGDGGDGRSGDE